MQIFVLGMHRSGTSVVTRLLNLMGMYFGPESILTAATDQNPRGYWERRDVRAICNRLLHGAGADWWKLADFDVAKIPPDVLEEQLAAFASTLAELDEHRPWVLKEPRMCVLFPAVRPLLESPAAVIVHRDPVEIAMSLRRRNGFPLAVGLAQWELSIRSALIASSDIPRTIVRYGDLVEDVVGTTQQLCNELVELGVKGLHDPTKDDIEAFFADELYRNRSEGSAREHYLTAQQLELAAALDDGSALTRPVTPVSDAVRDVLSMFEIAEDAKAQLPVLRRAAARRQELEKQIAAERRAATDMRVWGEGLAEELDASRAKFEELQGRLNHAKVKNAALKRDLSDAKKRYTKLRNRRPVKVALRFSSVARMLRRRLKALRRRAASLARP